MSHTIAYYRQTLNTLAHRADTLVGRQRSGYSADRARRIVTTQAEYRGVKELTLLRFPGQF